MFARRTIRALVHPRVKTELLTSRATVLTDSMETVVKVKPFGFCTQGSHLTMENISFCLNKAL